MLRTGTRKLLQGAKSGAALIVSLAVLRVSLVSSASAVAVCVMMCCTNANAESEYRYFREAFGSCDQFSPDFLSLTRGDWIVDIEASPDGTFVLATEGPGFHRMSPEGEPLGQAITLHLQPGHHDFAIAPDGRIYVVDSYSTVYIRTFEGSTWSSVLGTFSQGSGPGEFQFPLGVDVAPSGTVYVADTGNARIQVFSPTHEFVRQWSRADWGDGHEPYRIAVNRNEEVYVLFFDGTIEHTDSEGNLISQWTVDSWYDSLDSQLSLDPAGNVYLQVYVYSDHWAREQMFAYTATGAIIGVIDVQEEVGEYCNQGFSGGVAFDAQGFAYVSAGYTVQKFWYPGTRIQASDPDLEFFVDGERYVGSHVFEWPVGSSHNVEATPAQFPAAGERQEFLHWDDGGALSHSITLAEPWGSYTAQFDRSYWLEVDLSGGGGSTIPPSGWFPESSQFNVTPVAEDHYQLAEWLGEGSGSYTGRDVNAAVKMLGPIRQRPHFVRHGYDFTISASAVDPFAVHVEPTGGVRHLYLWMTCGDRGLSALEADVTGTLTPLAFVPESNVLNVYGADRLFLAIAGCPTGDDSPVLLGHWIVVDNGGTLSLEPSATSGNMATVDCLFTAPDLWQNPRVFGFSSTADAPVVGTNACLDGAVPLQVTNLRAAPGLGNVRLNWDLVGGVGADCVIERRIAGASAYERLMASPLRVEMPCRYNDTTIQENTSYEYRIRLAGVDVDQVFGPVTAAVGEVPQFATRLEPIGPNPVVGRAEIRFALAAESDVKLAIYDVAGRLVKTVAAGRIEAGRHTRTWERTDDEGNRAPGGVFFARFESAGHLETKKIVVAGR